MPGQAHRQTPSELPSEYQQNQRCMQQQQQQGIEYDDCHGGCDNNDDVDEEAEEWCPSFYHFCVCLRVYLFPCMHNMYMHMITLSSMPYLVC